MTRAGRKNTHSTTTDSYSIPIMCLPVNIIYLLRLVTKWFRSKRTKNLAKNSTKFACNEMKNEHKTAHQKLVKKEFQTASAQTGCPAEKRTNERAKKYLSDIANRKERAVSAPKRKRRRERPCGCWLEIVADCLNKKEKKEKNSFGVLRTASVRHTDRRQKRLHYQQRRLLRNGRNM